MPAPINPTSSIISTPNQPITLDPNVVDPCNVGDNKAYQVLYNVGDTLYYQFQQSPCGDDNIEGGLDPDSSEKLTNGSFTNSSNGWTLGTNWAWDAAGYVGHAAGSTAALEQTGLTIPPGTWIVSFSITSRTTGDVTFNIGANASASYPTLPGATGQTGTTIITTSLTESTFSIIPSSDFDGRIESVGLSSGGDWSYGLDWNVADGFACHTPGSTSLLSYTMPAITPGNYYFRFRFTVSNMTEGIVSINPWGGTEPGISVTENGSYTYYINEAMSDGVVSFEVSEEFDGCISAVSAFNLHDVNQYTFELIDSTGDVFEDISAHASQINDRIELAYDLDIPEGCYTLRVTDPCVLGAPGDEEFESNSFWVKTSHDCTKAFEAYNDSGTSLGFCWDGNFKLFQRVRFLSYNPDYNVDGDDYQYSNGSRAHTSIKREKYHVGQLDWADENFHDTMSASIFCNKLYVDSVEKFVKQEDYKPEWEKNGQRRLAQARIAIRDKSSTIYNVK